MKKGNWTSATEFILLGLTDDPRLQVPLFMLFLIVYIVTLLGNATMMALIKFCPRFHTSMYFLLSNLSFVDLCYSSNITPAMLANFLSETKVISLFQCAAQFFFFSVFGSTEVFLLAIMSYDRYVAICNPLLYTAIMTKKYCIHLIVSAYIIGFLNSFANTCLTFTLSFCESNRITHFYCDVPPLLKLSCSDTTINEVVLMLVAGAIIVGSLVVILTSYTYIISAILKIGSSKGRSKAFSTCSSHFICVTLFFGTIMFMYIRPSSNYSMDQDRVASVFYTVIIPMLNPLIYSLRNQDVIETLKNVMGHKRVSN